MFFHLKPPTAFLSDRLQDLTMAYRAVRDDLPELIELLSSYQRRHESQGKAFYYATRETDSRSLNPVERAARVIYLNKTCYNGVYRVNSAGRFNVPMGVYKSPRILDKPTLVADSAALKGSTIKHLDYTSALERVERGDFVYLDPPYFGQFTGYHQNGFAMGDQERLSEQFRSLHEKGALVLLSDGSDDWITKLYRGFKQVKLGSQSVLSGKVKGRGRVEELLVLNYDPQTGETL